MNGFGKGGFEDIEKEGWELRGKGLFWEFELGEMRGEELGKGIGKEVREGVWEDEIDDMWKVMVVDIGGEKVELLVKLGEDYMV